MLSRIRPAVIGNVAMGAVATIAGLIQVSIPLMGAGIAWIFASATVLTLTYLVDRGTAEMIVQGTIVVPQQPELSDVRAHAAHITELAEVT